MIAATDIDLIIGSEAVDEDNDRVGRVSQVYLDTDSERPTWATLKTGLFGASESLVPLGDASWDEGTLHLAVDKASVKGAPRVDPDAEISVAEQQRLYTYYGFAADPHGEDGQTVGFDDDECLSYSRSDEDTSDLDAGFDCSGDTGSSRSTDAVGAAADLRLDGDPAEALDADEQAQQREVHLRRYVGDAL